LWERRREKKKEGAHKDLTQKETATRNRRQIAGPETVSNARSVEKPDDGKNGEAPQRGGETEP